VNMEAEDFFRIIKQNHGLKFIDKKQTEFDLAFGSNGKITFYYDRKWGPNYDFSVNRSIPKRFPFYINIRVEKRIGTEYLMILSRIVCKR
jgi:hypothetical protein